MYIDLYSKEITKKLSKLKKKNPAHYSIVRKKMDSIIAEPTHSYKFLHHDMKGVKRVHIGHFVLVFTIDHVSKTISFEDYDYIVKNGCKPENGDILFSKDGTIGLSFPYSQADEKIVLLSSIAIIKPNNIPKAPPIIIEGNQ